MDCQTKKMKSIILKGSVLIMLLGTVGCQQKNTSEEIEEILEEEVQEPLIISVKGEIQHIENGKDGYVATLRTEDGTIYHATISMVNLQKHGSEFSRYEAGDKITVSGEVWEDGEGNKNVVVHQLTGE